MTSWTDQSGAQTPSSTPGTLSVDSSGNVTLVGTNSNTTLGGINYCNMIIIQITGQTYADGKLPAGILTQHFIAEVDFTNSPDYMDNSYAF
jgi:hypothetical protein